MDNCGRDQTVSFSCTVFVNAKRKAIELALVQNRDISSWLAMVVFAQDVVIVVVVVGGTPSWNWTASSRRTTRPDK
jgi:hypothetical protein